MYQGWTSLYKFEFTVADIWRWVSAQTLWMLTAGCDRMCPISEQYMCRTLVVSFHTWALLTWKYMLVCWKCCSVFHWLLSCFYFFFVCLSLENSNNGSNCMSINHFCLWDQWKPKICNEVWCSVYITVAPSGESVLPKVSVFVHQIFTTTEAAVLQTGQWPTEVWVDQS